MSYRVLRHLGYKGVAFIIFGVMFILLGAANIGGPPPSDIARENMTILLRILPIEGWYASWILAGLCAVVAAFVPRLESTASALTFSLPFTFSICYFFAALLDLGYRAWAAGLIYLMIAGLVGIIAIWPDPIRIISPPK